MAVEVVGFTNSQAVKIRGWVVDEHKAFRNRWGGGSLRNNARLRDRAQRFANYMARQSRFVRSGNNTKPTGGVRQTLWYGDKESDGAGENVARYQRSVQRVMFDWRNSCRNFYTIINDYNRMGVGVARVGNSWYWCVQFNNGGDRFNLSNACNGDDFKASDPRKPSS